MDTVEWVPIIGIDLGTTNSCVGAVKNGKIGIIANEDGKRTTPSVVKFTRGTENELETTVGMVAKDDSSAHASTTIFDIKRLMGRKFNDQTTQNYTNTSQLEIENRNGTPVITLDINGIRQTFTPEEISSIILEYMKQAAEDHLGAKVKRAVITVPAYFNNAQREATIDAARIAGLEVVRIINEPTAAALAYASENHSSSPRNVLVYDLGGGTFDVSVVHIDGKKYSVRASSGDSNLGGTDFDTRLMNYCVDEFKKKFGIDISKEKIAMRRLRSACESTKEKLSYRPSVEMELFFLSKEKDFVLPIERTKLEEINADLFQKTLDIMKDCLNSAGIGKDEITDTVLIGGSTRIPKIKELLTTFFGGKPLKKSTNPDESVAFGAALLAASLDAEKSGIEFQVEVFDVIALSIGIETAVGKITRYVERNTPIPFKTVKKQSTAFDHQTEAHFYIYQGERRTPEGNDFLGKFTIKNLPKKPKGEVLFSVQLSIDCNGMLSVSAFVDGSEAGAEIKINLQNNRLEEEEIRHLVKQAQTKKEIDDRKLALSKAKYNLVSYCISAKIRAQSVSEIDEGERENMVNMCEEGIKQNKYLINTNEAEQKLKDIKVVCDRLFQM